MFELPPVGSYAKMASAEPMDIRPAIFLDYGVDGASHEDTACEVCERGMRFRSRWCFEIGSMVKVAFAFDHSSLEKVEVEGAVIECHAAQEGGYQTTLLFLELPKGLRTSLTKVSSRLNYQQR